MWGGSHAALAAALCGFVCTAAVAVPTPAQEVSTRGEPIGDPADEVAPSSYARRHALVIGVDDFSDSYFPNLAYAEADAGGIAKLLVDDLGFEREDVRLILGKDATKDELESALMDWACDPTRIGEDDLLVVFFAGHGVTRDLGSRGRRGYLVPVDGRTDQKGSYVWSTLFGMRDLEDISEAIPAKHVLVVLDCCFGGLAIKRDAPPVAAGLSTRARQVLTAGTGEQAVLDGGGGGHSIFTASVLDGVRGGADLDGDRVVTFGELYNYVGRKVEDKTDGRQTPLQATLPDHEGGSVALFEPGVQPGAISVGDRLKSLERTTEQQLEELKQLSDALVVIELLERERDLWPRREHKVVELREWLGLARDVYSRLPQHEDFLQRVRQETYMRQILAGLVVEGEGTEPLWEEADPLLRWKYETLDNLVTNLQELHGAIDHVSARLEFALNVKRLTIDDHAAEWDEVIADVRASELYDGMRIEPQLGLIPIGKDPDTDLWEFWHPGTGERPERHPSSGRLLVSESTGMVFVLIPCGVFEMGAVSAMPLEPLAPPNLDPYALPNEGPVHEIELDAFFLSKFEMTQGQWLLITRENPSQFGPGQVHGDIEHSALHPVENVSWVRCREVLTWLELEIPTEAQWEYSARAGTKSPWWTGEGMDSLHGAVNMVDQSTRRAGLKMMHLQVYPALDDGFVYHSPVDAHPSNPFGLHDVHGNLWEWVRDRYGDYSLGVAPGDGARLDVTDSQHVVRGGSYRYDPTWGRSAVRLPSNPAARDNALGLRPSRAVRK